MLEMPPVPEDQRATAELPVRYEDVAQDGRVRLTALPTALGAACWQQLLMDHPVAALARDEGILPILSRLVIEGGAGPVSVHPSLVVRGGYQLAHTVDETGAPERIIMNLFAEVEGVRGRTHGPPPPDAGAAVIVGRVFAEHVFTRPFALAGERKVSRLPHAALPDVPTDRHPWHPPDRVATLSQNTALEPEMRSDPAPIVFGLTHTDSNHHVNSLVYPRLFEDASLRRLAELDRPTTVLAQRAQIGYRKPCFAGDEMRLTLRAFEDETHMGTVGAFEPNGGGRPHVYVRMTFGR